jgi:hypothetical protein
MLPMAKEIVQQTHMDQQITMFATTATIRIASIAIPSNASTRVFHWARSLIGGDRARCGTISAVVTAYDSDEYLRACPEYGDFERRGNRRRTNDPLIFDRPVCGAGEKHPDSRGSARVSLTTRTATSAQIGALLSGPADPRPSQGGSPSKFCSTLEVCGSRELSIGY